MLRQADTNILLWLNSLLGIYPLLDMFFFFLAEYLIYFMPLGYIGAFAKLKTKPSKWLGFVLLVFLAVLLALLVNYLIGMFFFRNRPFVGHQILYYASPGLLPKSFPSDHTTVAFLLASALFWGGYKMWGLILLSFAVVIGLSRIIIGVHYPSDILAGAAIGIGLGCLVAAIWRRLSKPGRPIDK